MADGTVQGAQGNQGGADHRKAFVVGAVVGAGAGVVTAFLNAPRSGRATRAGIQQGIEGVLFRVLDMRPTHAQMAPAYAGDDLVATTTLTPAAPPAVATTAPGAFPTDVVIDGPRHADLHA